MYTRFSKFGFEICVHDDVVVHDVGRISNLSVATLASMITRLSGTLNPTNASPQSLGVAIPQIVVLTATETKDDTDKEKGTKNTRSAKTQRREKPEGPKKKRRRNSRGPQRRPGRTTTRRQTTTSQGETKEKKATTKDQQ